MAHPELSKLAIELRALYVTLPETLQTRLLMVDIELFLQCDNNVDLYSLREYLIKKNMQYTLLTLSERINAELEVAIRISELNAYEKYQSLPSRNVNFYRSPEYQYESVIKESVEEEKCNPQNESLIVCEEEKMNLYQDYQQGNSNINGEEFIKGANQYTQMIHKGNTAIDETMGLGKRLFDMVKVILSFVPH